MKIKKYCITLLVLLLSGNLYATDYYFCKLDNKKKIITREQGDSFVIYYNKDTITLMDQIHSTNLIFKKNINKRGDKYALYQRKEGSFNYTAKVYKSKLLVKLTRYNKLDGINIPETTFKCTQGSNNRKQPPLAKNIH